MDSRKFPSEEPSAVTRDGARAIREMFVALVQAGFTEKQALTIVGESLRASIGRGSEEG